ncbi:MAG TPA: hypothetical protein PKC91_11425 [Ignavibacteria bacterium]|nr:hypothetical protein [Ignavibacteria bacterium]
MLKSSLLEILRTFSKEESLKFEDFINSPYLNKNSNTIKLNSALRKYSPEYISKELDKEIVWKVMFPGKEYNYGTMKNLIHELSKLAMKFIVLEEFEENILERDNILMNCLNERNITKLFNVKMNELDRQYSKESFKKDYFFINDFYSAYSKMNWIKIYHNRANNLNAVTEKDLINSSATFIYSFLIYLFKYYNNVMTDSINQNFSMEKNILPVFLKRISPDIIEKLLTIVKENSKRDYNILNVFWKMSRSQLNNQNVEYFLDFKKSLYDNIGILSKWDAKDLFSLMGNSLNNLDPSKINVEKELFELTDSMLRSGIIFNRDGTITTSDFILYNWRAFNAGEYEAINKFTVKYLNKIPVESMEYSKKISLAFLLFGEGNFEEVLEIITSLQHPNFIIKVRMKHLKAKCLYELNDFISFDSEYKTIYHFLKNNKSLSSKVKNDTKYLFEMIKKMFRLREKLNEFEFEELKNEISMGSFNKRSWLNVKINEFK